MSRTRSIIMTSVSLLLATSPQVGAAAPASDCAPAVSGAANIAVEPGAVVVEESATRGTAPNQAERHRIFSGTTGDTTHQPGSNYCGRGSCEASRTTGSNPNVQVGSIANTAVDVVAGPDQVAAHHVPSRRPPDPSGPVHLPGSKHSDGRTAAASGYADVRAELGAVASGESTARATTGPAQAGRHRLFTKVTGDTVHLPGSRYCRGSCEAPTVTVGTNSAAGLRGSYQIPKEALSAAVAAAAADAATKDKCQAAPRARE